MTTIPRLTIHVTSPEEATRYHAAGATHLIIDNSYYSNRSMVSSKDPQDIQSLLKFCQNLSPKPTTSITCDVVLHNHMVPSIITLFETLKDTPPDYIRFQDLGILPLIQEILPQSKATYINETGSSNVESLRALKTLGTPSIQLNNELPYSEIKTITSALAAEWQLQIHGHILIQHSHRQLLKNVTNSTKQKFIRSEDQDFKGRFYHFFESDHGCFMFGHFDRCLAPVLDKVLKCPLSDWIIDCRGLEVAHNETVLNHYKALLEDIKGINKDRLDQIQDALAAQSDMPLKIGFFNVNKTDIDWRDQKKSKTTHYHVLGHCIDIQKQGHILIELEETIKHTDQLYILTPEEKELPFHKPHLSNLSGTPLESSESHPIVKLNWIKGVTAGSKLVRLLG